jgi:hypothetical protein
MSLVTFRRDWTNFWRFLRDLWEEAGQPDYRAGQDVEPPGPPGPPGPLGPPGPAEGPDAPRPAAPIALPSGCDVLWFEDLVLDTRTRDVSRRDRPVELTPTEFRLLELLLRNPRQVLTRELIFDRVWGFDFGPSSNTLSVYIGYLRRKTEAEGESRLIHTVRGVGYMLRE